MKGRFYIAFIMIVLFSSCSKQKINDAPEDVNTVTFKNNLRQLSNGVLYESDSVLELLNGRKKIVSIVDGVCMKCVINDLNYADEVFQEIIGSNNLNKVVYILNVPSADSLYFLKHFEPSINVKGIVLWDNSYSFEKLNGLLTADKSYRTFLIDENNQIKLAGSPLYDSELMSNYTALLQE